MHRRSFLQAGAAASLLGSFPRFAARATAALRPAARRAGAPSRSLPASKSSSRRAPRASGSRCPRWRATTRRCIGNTWSGNGSARIMSDGKYGAAMVVAEWSASEKAPVLEVVSTFSTQNRAVDFGKRNPQHQARSGDGEVQRRADRADPDRRHRAQDRVRDHARQEHGRATRRARSTTGSSTTRSAIRRRAAAAWATSRRCSRPATSAASAPT